VLNDRKTEMHQNLEYFFYTFEHVVEFIIE